MSRGQPIVFTTQHRARFEELDLNGHLNTISYISYYLENRFAGHREYLGLTLRDIGQLDFAIYTKKLEVDFIRPIFADDAFKVESFVQEAKGKLVLVKATILKAEKPASVGQIALVCIEKATGQPMDWPEEFLGMFFESAAKTSSAP